MSLIQRYFDSPPSFYVSIVGEALAILTGDSTLGCEGFPLIRMPRGTNETVQRSP